jgi:hypothetical protein
MFSHHLGTPAPNITDRKKVTPRKKKTPGGNGPAPTRGDEREVGRFERGAKDE